MYYKEEHNRENYQTEESKSNKSLWTDETCDICHGSGVVGDGTCGSCNGKGII